MDKTMDKTKYENTASTILSKNIVHDIKNIKYFSLQKMIEINKMNPENRLEVLIAYNEMIKYCKEIIEYM